MCSTHCLEKKAHSHWLLFLTFVLFYGEKQGQNKHRLWAFTTGSESGCLTYIISLSLCKNCARHTHPHCVGGKTEVLISYVTEGIWGTGWWSWGSDCPPRSYLLQPPWCQLELPPSSGMQEWASSPLVSTVSALSILGVRGFPAGPPALVFNFKQHLVVECLHIRAN